MEPTAISNGAPTTVPTSQTTEIATNVPTAQTAPKLRVEMDESGRLKGPNSQQFATLTGELVRAHCLVSFLDWRIVPRILKENIWNKLMEKVKAATEKRKRLIDEGLVDPMDIDNDEITEVFGPDKGNSGLLGYSSHTSKAQTLQANLATSVMAAKGARMDEIELERTTQRITKIVLQAIRDQQKNQHPQAMANKPENLPVAMAEQQHNIKLWESNNKTNMLATINQFQIFRESLFPITAQTPVLLALKTRRTESNSCIFSTERD
ncbi:hypothetical protein MKW92_053391 [Papaver armeniacum]|nr:hypothetical protein MKW92_053391 [Papaver armeniacum]